MFFQRSMTRALASLIAKATLTADQARSRGLAAAVLALVDNDIPLATAL